MSLTLTLISFRKLTSLSNLLRYRLPVDYPALKPDNLLLLQTFKELAGLTPVTPHFIGSAKVITFLSLPKKIFPFSKKNFQRPIQIFSKIFCPYLKTKFIPAHF